MKRIIGYVAAAALASCSFAGATANARPGPTQKAQPARSVAKPKTAPAAVSCSIAAVKIGIGTASAVKPVCRYVKSHRPVPISIRRSLQITDVAGNPCHITPPTGTSKSFSFKPAVPYQIKVSFTVSPKTGKGKPATKSVAPRSNPASRDVCEATPVFTTVPAGSQNYCSLPTVPTFLPDYVFRVGVIACPADWSCKWVADRPSPEEWYGFHMWGLGDGQCINNALPGSNKTVKLRLYVDLWSSQDHKTGCVASFNYASVVPVMSSWKGDVWWDVSVDNYIPDPTQPSGYSDIPEHPPNGPYYSWEALKPGGNVDPCSPMLPKWEGPLNFP
jgi:hypothetical protein